MSIKLRCDVIIYCCGLISYKNGHGKLRATWSSVTGDPAEHLITGTQKHKRGLLWLLRDYLHWLMIPWLFIDVFNTELQGTVPTVACQFPATNMSVWPAITDWIICSFVAAHLAPGLSQLLARWFGNRCLIHCMIRPSSLDALGRTWKRISLPDIRHGCIRGGTVLCNRAIQINIYILILCL